MMTSIFLFFFLITTLISAFLYHRTNQEVHLVLAVFSGIVCLLWGLIVAHWSILLISLLVLLSIPTPIIKPKAVNIYHNR